MGFTAEQAKQTGVCQQLNLLLGRIHHHDVTLCNGAITS